MSTQGSVIKLYRSKSVGTGGAIASGLLLLVSGYMLFYTEPNLFDFLIAFLAILMATITLGLSLKSIQNKPFYILNETEIKWLAITTDNFSEVNKTNGYHIFYWQDIQFIEKRKVHIEAEIDMVYLKLKNGKNYYLPLNFLRIQVGNHLTSISEDEAFSYFVKMYRIARDKRQEALKLRRENR